MKNHIIEFIVSAICYPLAIFAVFAVANNYMGYQFTNKEILSIAFGLVAGHTIRGPINSWWKRRRELKDLKK